MARRHAMNKGVVEQRIVDVSPNNGDLIKRHLCMWVSRRVREAKTCGVRCDKNRAT